MEYEIVVGLEVHAQLLTESKLFCGCRPKFGSLANTHGCPVCLGLPGALPVLNRKAVEMAVRMGLAVGCSIQKKSIFSRKNYFYPDLPKGYQISQYDMPICGPGSLPIAVNGYQRTIGITRIHLEEDAGKLIHDQDIDSLFDVNRCSTPLIEIVSDPDMHSPAEAYAYLINLKEILDYLGICDCNMEEGSLRCDANISIRPKGEKKLGTKTEIKNMNSFRGLEKAVEYEAARQEEVLRSGGTILQQTFLWDPVNLCSIPMRTKEDAHDYRYFPEPDLTPLIIEDSYIEELRKTLPELPDARRTRFQEQYQITPSMADVLTSSQTAANYFEKTVEITNDSRTTANWVATEVLRICKEQKLEITDLKITPERLGALLGLLGSQKISGNTAKKVFDLVQSLDKDPELIVTEQGLTQMSDTSELEAIMKTIIDANPNEVERFKGGDKKLTAFFVGQAMKATKGRGNPKEINQLLSSLIK